jgi:hypothetical protein
MSDLCQGDKSDRHDQAVILGLARTQIWTSPSG